MILRDQVTLSLSKGNNDDSISEAIRPLSHDEMESVSGGFLMVPPIHGGAISIPSIPLLPTTPVH